MKFEEDSKKIYLLCNKKGANINLHSISTSLPDYQKILSFKKVINPVAGPYNCIILPSSTALDLVLIKTYVFSLSAGGIFKNRMVSLSSSNKL